MPRRWRITLLRETSKCVQEKRERKKKEEKKKGGDMHTECESEVKEVKKKKDHYTVVGEFWGRGFTKKNIIHIG